MLCGEAGIEETIERAQALLKLVLRKIALIPAVHVVRVLKTEFAITIQIVFVAAGSQTEVEVNVEGAAVQQTVPEVLATRAASAQVFPTQSRKAFALKTIFIRRRA